MTRFTNKFIFVLAALTFAVCALSCGGSNTTSSSPAPAAQSVPRVSLANTSQTIRVGDAISYDASQGGRTFTDTDRDALSYTVSFAPDSFGLTSSGPIIEGTAALEGVATVTITVRDTDGNTVDNSFEITVVPRQIERVFVTQEQGAINIFVKGSTEPSEQYLRYRFEQFDKPAIRAKGWGWRELHEATMVSYGNFTTGDRLLNGGENFIAIREVGKSDFMGGANHGEQIDSSFILLIDDVEVAIDGLTPHVAETVELKQVSTLYEVDAPILISTAVVHTDYKITFGINLLKNRVEFTRPTELSTALMTMASNARYLNGDINSGVYLDTAYYLPNLEPIDISHAGHDAPRLSNAKTIRLSGESGFTQEITMTSGWEAPNRRVFVNNGNSNNKVYFSPIGSYPSIGPGLQVPAGHVIEVEAEYRLDTLN